MFWKWSAAEEILLKYDSLSLPSWFPPKTHTHIVLGMMRQAVFDCVSMGVKGYSRRAESFFEGAPPETHQLTATTE